MAHHKRKRSKKARAGCLLCKPQKMNGQRNGFAAQSRQEQLARTGERVLQPYASGASNE